MTRPTRAPYRRKFRAPKPEPVPQRRYCNACGKRLHISQYARDPADCTGYRRTCKACVRERRRSRQSGSVCGYCGEQGHNSRSCQERTGNGKYCGRCADLSHRPDKPRCKRCGEPFEELPDPSLLDRGNRRSNFAKCMEA